MAASMSGIVCRVLRTNLASILSTRNSSICLGWQISYCSYHASSCLFKGAKRARRVEKMFVKKKKKFYYDPMNVAQLGQLATGAIGTSSKTKMQSEDSIRLRTYNKILFDNINEMMTTSLISEELEELQITVLGVRVSGDMSACRVYWMSTGSVNEDDKIEAVLDRYRGPLRRALISHRVLGKIPPIFFLKDKVRAKISEIDRLLSIADFGPDDEESVIVNEYDHQEPDRSEIDGRIEFMQKTAKGSLSDRGGTPQASLFGIDHDAVHRMISANKSMDHTTDVRTEPNERNLDKKLEQFRVFLKKKKLSKADRKQAAFYKGELEAFRSSPSREIRDSNSTDEEEDDDRYLDDEYDIQDNEDKFPWTDNPTRDD